MTILNAVMQLFRGSTESLSHWATVCSTWVFLSRGSTMRTPRDPEAQEWAETHLSVAAANTMCCRVTVFLVLLQCLGVDWVHEQPLAKLADLHKVLVLGKRRHQGNASGCTRQAPTWVRLEETP